MMPRRALVVGGGSDRLRGVASKDVDVEIFGIPAHRLSALLTHFGRVEAVGQSFAVYKLVPAEGAGASIDVALPRRESKSGRGHKGFVVEGDPSMSVAEAARRRDFTINAISWDPLTGEYEDRAMGATTSFVAHPGCRPATFGDDSLRCCGTPVRGPLQLRRRADGRISRRCR